MVTAFAFVATAVAALFAEAMLVRFTRSHRIHQITWTIALAMFTVASAALALGSSQGFDPSTFRVFFAFGALLDVPWLALGTVQLLASERVARRVRGFVVFFSGLALGTMLASPMAPVRGTAIPVGKEVFGTLPRVLAAVGSGVGAMVIVGGAVWSAVRYLARRGTPGAARRAAANALIATGTLLLSAGGVLQGTVGHDEAFATTLATGIVVIYAGFLLADDRTRHRSDRDPS